MCRTSGPYIKAFGKESGVLDLSFALPTWADLKVFMPFKYH